MSDPLAAFEDLRPFPGKRQPANRQPAVIPPLDVERWDLSPRTYKVKGVDTEFFTVGDLAVAVSRSPRTIRYWEANRIIPPATFRAPKPHKSQLKQIGDRLYSREQIEAIVAIAEEEGVLDGKAPTRRFTERVFRAWLALQRGSS